MFQIEAPDDAAVTVTTRDGHTFATILPQGLRKGEISHLGAVTCCGATIHLGVLDAAPIPGEKGSK